MSSKSDGGAPPQKERDQSLLTAIVFIAVLAAGLVGAHGAMNGNAKKRIVAEFKPTTSNESVSAPTVQTADPAAFLKIVSLLEIKSPMPPLPSELREVREVSLEDPLPDEWETDVRRGHYRDLIKQIRLENYKKQDGFLIAQMDRRPELRGLPFMMGDECRLSRTDAELMQSAVTTVHRAFANFNQASESVDLWDLYAMQKPKLNQSDAAALTQIFGPGHPKLKAGVVRQLRGMQNLRATKELVKLAIFDLSSDVRTAALDALKDRPKEEYGDALIHGLRYPLGYVAEQAANAIVVLRRTDLLPDVAAVLGETAPGDPYPVHGNKTVYVVREVVRVNHLRNCLLCHAPAEVGNEDEVPGLVQVSNAPRRSGYSGTLTVAQEIANGEHGVRADVTYLRQDFSLMMANDQKDANSVIQRFDFVVRTRVVEGDELNERWKVKDARSPEFLSANQKASVHVLRKLSGRDAPPTREAWEQVLRISAANVPP